MRLVLDIDDTITHAPEFFARLTERFSDSEIAIVTYRVDAEPTRRVLAEHDIRYDSLITSGDPKHGVREGQSLDDWKVEAIERLEPDIVFEDMPEIIHRLDPSIAVFMACDEMMREWIRDRIDDR